MQLEINPYNSVEYTEYCGPHGMVLHVNELYIKLIQHLISDLRLA